jgi:hypothetical protein
MRTTGACLDNAVAARFCGRLKGDRMALQHAVTRQAAREDGVDDIERFYNSPRLHSSLGDVSPNDDEGLAKGASLRVRYYLTRIGFIPSLQSPPKEKSPLRPVQRPRR